MRESQTVGTDTCHFELSFALKKVNKHYYYLSATESINQKFILSLKSVKTPAIQKSFTLMIILK